MLSNKCMDFMDCYKTNIQPIIQFLNTLNLMMASKRNITSRDCIHLANDIIVDRNLLIPRLTSMKDINFQLFCLLFDDIFRIDCSIFNPKTKSQQIDCISRLLSTLSNDLIGISLEHIKAQDIVDKNLNTIYDLLEIIVTFIKYIPKQFNKHENENNRNENINENEKILNSIKRKFSTKGIQTNGYEKDSFDVKLKNEYLNYNTNNKSEKYSNLLKSSSSSTSYSAQSSVCECPDIIQSTSQHSSHSNSCGDNNTCHPKQELITPSKAIQKHIEPKSLPKTPPKVISFDEFKRLKTDNFATELGHRLHEALKLKEMSEVIENKIKKYYGDVTVQTPSRSKNVLKLKSGRKQLIRSKKSPIKRKIDFSKVKTTKQDNQFSSLDDLIKTYPEISRNTIKSLREQEKRQKIIVESLHKDVGINETKVKSKLNSAIETQNKRSQIIKNEIKHLESLAMTKNAKLEKMRENAVKRDTRLERARMHKTIESFHNDMVSKYKKLQAIEEKLVIKEYQKRHKAQEENIAQFRKRIQENHSMEMERQRKMLDAFENLYRNKYEMLSENLFKEEQQLKNQISQQSHYLRSMKNEYKNRFETDFRNLFNSKI